MKILSSAINPPWKIKKSLVWKPVELPYLNTASGATVCVFATQFTVINKFKWLKAIVLERLKPIFCIDFCMVEFFCVCLYEVHESIGTQGATFIWKPEDNLRHPFSGTVHLVYGSMLANWNRWLSNQTQGYAPLSLGETGIKWTSFMPDFLMWSLDIKHACKSIILPPSLFHSFSQVHSLRTFAFFFFLTAQWKHQCGK